MKYPGIVPNIWGDAFFLERGFDHFHLIIREIYGPSVVEIKWPTWPLEFFPVKMSVMLSDLRVMLGSYILFFAPSPTCSWRGWCTKGLQRGNRKWQWSRCSVIRGHSGGKTASCSILSLGHDPELSQHYYKQRLSQAPKENSKSHYSLGLPQRQLQRQRLPELWSNHQLFEVE